MKTGDRETYAGNHGEPQVRPKRGTPSNYGWPAGLAPSVKAPVSHLDLILSRHEKILGTTTLAFGGQPSA